MPESTLSSVVLPAPFGPMIACTAPRSSATSTASSAATPPKRLPRSSRAAASPAFSRVGTSPRGMKIMVSISTAPSSTISYSLNTVRSCGSVVSTAAPTTAPKVEAMPPNTTMVTSSIECRNEALAGVMKPGVVRESAPATAANSAEITNAVSLCARGVDADERRRRPPSRAARASARPRGESIRFSASQTAPTSAAPTSQYQDFRP